MPYLGRPVTNAGQFETIDDISSDFNGSTKSFTLQVGGTNIQPDASNVTITLDGIVQIPSTAYTITGSTINFSEAPPSSTGFHGVLAGQSQFIESDFITNTHIKSSANISGSKINTDFSGKTIKASVFEGMISGSAQISTDISGSFTSPSSSFSTRTTNLESASGSFSTRVTTIEGSGTVQGVGTSNSPTFAGATINGTLVANEIHTTFVSSSVATITGSNVFGDAVGDLHSFTGSVSISGSQTSLVTAGNVDFNGDLDVDGTTNLDVVDIDGAVDMASTLTIGGDLTIPQKIVHSGDTDTYLSFGTDSLSLYTGGTNVVSFEYGNIYIKQNNKAITGYTTGGGAKELIKIDGSDVVQIGEGQNTNFAGAVQVSDNNLSAKMTTAGSGIRVIADRVDTSDFAGFEAQTGGNQRWFIGVREDSTDNLHFYNGNSSGTVQNVLTLNHSDSSATFADTVTIGTQQGSKELMTNRARMRHIDGVADANASFSHGDLYVNHISTGNIYMQRDTTFAGQALIKGGAFDDLSLAFSNDTDTGIYNGGIGATAFVQNGNIALELQSSLISEFRGLIKHKGTSNDDYGNTAFETRAANNSQGLKISHGGGNGKLELFSGNQSRTQFYANQITANVNGLEIKTTDGQSLTLGTNNTTRMTIDSAGRAEFKKLIYRVNTEQQNQTNLIAAYHFDHPDTDSVSFFDFNPPLDLGLAATGGSFFVKISGWQLDRFFGLVTYRNNGGSGDINSGDMALDTIVNDGFSVSVSAPSGNLIRFQLSGHHNNNHGFNFMAFTAPPVT